MNTSPCDMIRNYVSYSNSSVKDNESDVSCLRHSISYFRDSRIAALPVSFEAVQRGIRCFSRFPVTNPDRIEAIDRFLALLAPALPVGHLEHFHMYPCSFVNFSLELLTDDNDPSDIAPALEAMRTYVEAITHAIAEELLDVICGDTPETAAEACRFKLPEWTNPSLPII